MDSTVGIGNDLNLVPMYGKLMKATHPRLHDRWEREVERIAVKHPAPEVSLKLSVSDGRNRCSRCWMILPTCHSHRSHLRRVIHRGLSLKLSVSDGRNRCSRCWMILSTCHPHRNHLHRVIRRGLSLGERSLLLQEREGLIHPPVHHLMSQMRYLGVYSTRLQQVR